MSDSDTRRVSESADPLVPVVSVVIVGDYAIGTEVGWEELRATLAGLAAQEFDEPVELILCESDRFAGKIPAEIRSLLPTLKVIASPSETSYALKNDGVRAARAELVAVLDADVVPERRWLRVLVDSMRRHPKSAVVSSRTLHADPGFLSRALALITRGHIDPGDSGATRFVANHAAIYHRKTALDHPFHPTGGPFSSRLQSESMLRAGLELRFDGDAIVYHTFAGWAVHAEIARNGGYGTIVTRQIDPLQPFASFVRLGVASIPLFVVGKTLEGFRDCLRCYRAYGIRIYELPVLFLLMACSRWLEIPGMWRALRGKSLGTTVYR